MRHARFMPLIVTAALLGGCATAIPPVEVTRFHRIDTPAAFPAGSFAVEAQAGRNSSGALADRSYAAAVEREMQRLGYSAAAPGAPADYRVTVTVDRDERVSAERGSGVSVGVGGSTGGYRSGVGVGVGLDLTRLFGGGARDIVVTRMSVRIDPRAGGMALWEGRAETAARDGTPAAQPGLAADKLAHALFADFPGRSGETISVP